MTFASEDFGQQLGEESVENVVHKMEELCSREQRRIALVNEGPILRLKVEFAILRDQERDIAERLRFAPTNDLRRNRRRKLYAWAVACC